MENPKDTQQKSPDQKYDQKSTDQKHDQKHPENKPNTDSQKKPAQGIDEGKQTPRPTSVPQHDDEQNQPEKKRA
jgi:hypothetical protein